MRFTELRPLLQQTSLELERSYIGHSWWSDGLRTPYSGGGVWASTESLTAATSGKSQHMYTFNL